MKLRSSRIVGLNHKTNKIQNEEHEEIPEHNFTRVAIMSYCLGIVTFFVYSSYEFMCFCDLPQNEVMEESYNFSNLLHDII